VPWVAISVWWARFLAPRCRLRESCVRTTLERSRGPRGAREPAPRCSRAGRPRPRRFPAGLRMPIELQRPLPGARGDGSAQATVSAIGDDPRRPIRGEDGAGAGEKGSLSGIEATARGGHRGRGELSARRRRGGGRLRTRRIAGLRCCLGARPERAAPARSKAPARPRRCGAAPAGPPSARRPAPRVPDALPAYSWGRPRPRGEGLGTGMGSAKWFGARRSAEHARCPLHDPQQHASGMQPPPAARSPARGPSGGCHPVLHGFSARWAGAMDAMDAGAARPGSSARDCGGRRGGRGRGRPGFGGGGGLVERARARARTGLRAGGPFPARLDGRAPGPPLARAAPGAPCAARSHTRGAHGRRGVAGAAARPRRGAPAQGGVPPRPTPPARGAPASVSSKRGLLPQAVMHSAEGSSVRLSVRLGHTRRAGWGAFWGGLCQ
jgi:hypothetical protein